MYFHITAIHKRAALSEYSTDVQLLYCRTIDGVIGGKHNKEMADLKCQQFLSKIFHIKYVKICIQVEKSFNISANMTYVQNTISLKNHLSIWANKIEDGQMYMYIECRRAAIVLPNNRWRNRRRHWGKISNKCLIWNANNF